MDSVRLDRWLVAVRVYKTRAAATQACAGGKVRVNDAPVKPSSLLRVGDHVVASVGEQSRVLEVVRLIDKRVGAAVAAECFVDTSPPVEKKVRGVDYAVASRDAGAGRPTKRDRRAIDKFRGR